MEMYTTPAFTDKHIEQRKEMVYAYRVLKSKLDNVKIGNVGVFCKSRNCIDNLIREVGRNAVAL